MCCFVMSSLNSKRSPPDETLPSPNPAQLSISTDVQSDVNVEDNVVFTLGKEDVSEEFTSSNGIFTGTVVGLTVTELPRVFDMSTFFFEG